MCASLTEVRMKEKEIEEVAKENLEKGELWHKKVKIEKSFSVSMMGPFQH